MRLSSTPLRASVVLPLPPPSASDQSDSDECGRSDSDESGLDESDSDTSDALLDDEHHQQQHFVRYRASSASSSSISSALSFSRTSSDSDADADADADADSSSSDASEHALLHSDTDPEAPHDRARRRARAHSSSYVPLQTSRREITMAAIRNAETLGFVALLIPLTGIATMVTTEALACSYHFDCTRNYPTLSYAATFKPEGHAFMVGMCLTALFILLSSLLYYWFLRLRLGLSSSSSADAHTQYTALTCAVAGVATAVTLAGLAIYDMRSHHDAHIAFTVVFFIASWILIVFCHLARRLVLVRDSGLTSGTTPAPALRLPSASTALLHWRRMSIPMAFTLGRLFILAGITSTALFGLLFLCVNGSWPNPLGFTAVQEAFFEAFAIVCQLLFMGTLSCELALLSREVETRDYMELARRE